MDEAGIIDAVRTPRGGAGRETGAVSGIHPQQLLSQRPSARVRRTGIDGGDVADGVAGCGTAAGVGSNSEGTGLVPVCIAGIRERVET